MPIRIYGHLSWTTFGRFPLIDAKVADFLAPFLLAEAKRHSARIVEIGIVRDHVHLLLELPPAYDVPRLVQGLKGASARLANRDGHSTHKSLRWATGYDFRSVGIRQLPSVAAYVRDQELKHGSPRLQGVRPSRAGALAHGLHPRLRSLLRYRRHHAHARLPRDAQRAFHHAELQRAVRFKVENPVARAGHVQRG